MKKLTFAAATLLTGMVGTVAFAQDNVVRIEASGNIQESLQEALIMAEPGTVIELPEGTFSLAGGLSLDVAGVTVRGAGMDKTVLSFKNQISGSEGLLITADRTRIENLAIEDTPGDGLKAKGVDEITFSGVRVEWTRGPNAENGSYGLYPVESKHVLIENSVVKGASDAGIYVGQSQDIIVRNNRAELNVAGIEIENSYRADVFGNTSTHNTGGILVFDLPNLPQMGGHSVRVYDNIVVSNDTANFAPEGNIVATVPKGTGIMVMANREVEVFGNEVGENASSNILLVAYPREYNDPTYNPLPRRIYVHDNKHGRAGYDPDGAVKDLIMPRTGMPIPQIVWDGVVDGVWAGLFGPSDDEGIFIREAKGTTFANLQFVKDAILPWGADPDTDIDDYEGSVTMRGPVKLPQDEAKGAGR